MADLTSSTKARVISAEVIEDRYLYKVEAPMLWWIAQADGVQKITLFKPDINKFKDSNFEVNKLFTPCEEEDRGSTKVLFYLISMMNNYLNDFKDTDDIRFLLQIEQLIPASFLMTGILESKEQKEFEMS